MDVSPVKILGDSSPPKLKVTCCPFSSLMQVSKCFGAVAKSSWTSRCILHCTDATTSPGLYWTAYEWEVQGFVAPNAIAVGSSFAPSKQYMQLQSTSLNLVFMCDLARPMLFENRGWIASSTGCTRIADAWSVWTHVALASFKLRSRATAKGKKLLERKKLW